MTSHTKGKTVLFRLATVFVAYAVTDYLIGLYRISAPALANPKSGHFSQVRLWHNLVLHFVSRCILSFLIKWLCVCVWAWCINLLCPGGEW